MNRQTNSCGSSDIPNPRWGNQNNVSDQTTGETQLDVRTSTHMMVYIARIHIIPYHSMVSTHNTSELSYYIRSYQMIFLVLMFSVSYVRYLCLGILRFGIFHFGINPYHLRRDNIRIDFFHLRSENTKCLMSCLINFILKQSCNMMDRFNNKILSLNTTLKYSSLTNKFLLLLGRK